MDWSDMTRESQLREKCFLNAKHVSYVDLRKVFKEKAWDNNDEDAMKIVALYLLYYGLVGVDNRKVVYN